MPSLLGRIFGFVHQRPPAGTGRRPASQTAHAPGPSQQPRPQPQRRRDFSYADTSTWTFPHQPVVSSNLASVAYDFESQAMEIRFREPSANSSGTYRYSEVPLAVYRGLMDAPSKGQFFWRSIRDRYPFADMG